MFRIRSRGRFTIRHVHKFSIRAQRDRIWICPGRNQTEHRIAGIELRNADNRNVICIAIRQIKRRLIRTHCYAVRVITRQRGDRRRNRSEGRGHVHFGRDRITARVDRRNRIALVFCNIQCRRHVFKADFKGCPFKGMRLTKRGCPGNVNNINFPVANT